MLILVMFVAVTTTPSNSRVLTSYFNSTIASYKTTQNKYNKTRMKTHTHAQTIQKQQKKIEIIKYLSPKRNI